MLERREFEVGTREGGSRDVSLLEDGEEGSEGCEGRGGATVLEDAGSSLAAQS